MRGTNETSLDESSGVWGFKMKINELGKKLIMNWEGFELEAYPDPASPLANEKRKPLALRAPNWEELSGDPWTIGVGATGPGIEKGTKWTLHEVSNRLSEDIARFEDAVNEAVRVKINENQFSALVSFTFNLGEANLRSSTLLRKVNVSDFVAAAEEFPRWVYAQGQKLEGLKRRRLAEQQLFLLPMHYRKVA